MDYRVGTGNDLHRLIPGRPLVIGNISIPFDKGCDGHSDGDALIHAICDALLGAANQRDIGYHFPDNSAENKGRNSADFLRGTMKILDNLGWLVVNVDSTVSLEKPRLNPYIEAIKERLSEIMQLDVSRISVKAKTGEKMGPVGEGRAISVQAVALIQRK